MNDVDNISTKLCRKSLFLPIPIMMSSVRRTLQNSTYRHPCILTLELHTVWVERYHHTATQTEWYCRSRNIRKNAERRPTLCVEVFKTFQSRGNSVCKGQGVQDLVDSTPVVATRVLCSIWTGGEGQGEPWLLFRGELMLIFLRCLVPGTVNRSNPNQPRFYSGGRSFL